MFGTALGLYIYLGDLGINSRAQFPGVLAAIVFLVPAVGLALVARSSRAPH